MVGKRTASIVRAMRNARFTPPNGGPKEKLAFINRHEANLLRSLGGSGRRTKLGVPSYSWRDDSGSDTNGTQDGNGGSMDAGGNVSGTGSGSGPGGGNTQTGSTGAFAPRAPVVPLAPVVRPPVVPIPRMKPAVPAPFLGPNANVINTLPQIGGTSYADMMTAAINAGGPSTTPNATPGSGYGAPGGADNPANNPGDGGDGITSQHQEGPGKFGSESTQSFGTPPTRSIGTPPATMQRQPFSTYIRSPYKNPATYNRPGKIPDRNPFMDPANPIIENTPPALEQYGPIDQWKAAAAAAARRKAITDRLRQNPNFRVGDVFSPDSSRPRSPDPRDQRAY